MTVMDPHLHCSVLSTPASTHTVQYINLTSISGVRLPSASVLSVETSKVGNGFAIMERHKDTVLWEKNIAVYAVMLYTWGLVIAVHS